MSGVTPAGSVGLFPTPGLSARPGRERTAASVGVGGWVDWSETRALLVVLPATALYAAHAALFGDWLVDDAGITFAYARNLANGSGLVSQPGTTPVEGFSNPLWTLLLAALHALGLFYPPWTPKLLSLCLVGATFWIVVCTRPSPFSALVPVLLAMNTSFVVWTVSGLENPLLCFLGAALVALTMQAAEKPGRPLHMGALAALLALTRPDAILYAAPPLVVVLAANAGAREASQRLGRYLLGFGVVFLPYVAFRRIYFADWVPNTFHAKMGTPLASVDFSRLWELLDATTGRLAFVVVPLGILIAIRLARDRRLRPAQAALGGFLFISLVAYLVLPPDWMGEYRFATLFFLFFSWTLGELLTAAAPQRIARFSAAVLAAALVLETTPAFASRSASFAETPTVPFGRIVEFARGYETLARRLGRPDASLLTPDLGGMLYSTGLTVHDLAGLCDRTVARTLTRDRAAFHDYVFDRLAPTLIHVHASWAGWAGFHGDPRFLRDYAVLHEQWERPAGREPEDTGLVPWVGDYVRRDAVASREQLERLRRAFRELGLDRPLP